MTLPIIVNLNRVLSQYANVRFIIYRHILRNYGNMGAATILFALNKFRSDKKEDKTILVNPWTVAVAFGPGVTLEGLLLKSEPLT